MFCTGLLVLTSPLPRLRYSLPSLLNAVSQKVADTLYVHVAPGLTSLSQSVGCTTDMLETVSSVYSQSATVCDQLDVRVLLHNFRCCQGSPQMHGFPSLHKSCDVIFTDFSSRDRDSFVKLLRCAVLMPEVPLEFIASQESNEDPRQEESNCVIQGYDNVVLGGTFDRLHNGHKILLSQSLMRCNKLLAIGVTNGEMIAKKTLSELILPYEERVQELHEFLTDVKPSIQYHIEVLTDPYGISVALPQLESIVVSEESLKGGYMVNDRRKEKGFSELDIYVVKLVEDMNRSADEEKKISSSSQRRRLLGTLLHKPENKHMMSLGKEHLPYLIGLTGGIASGKTSICQRLKGLGASIIDADILGHKAYLKGTSAFQKVVETFGQDIVNDITGEIDRKKLGAQVFDDKEKLNTLNKIVWPAIADLVEVEVNRLSLEGARVVVLDAAVLLEAGWDSLVHEVWCTVIPKQEAVARLKERNNLSEEEALKRINSQVSNEARVEKSHVVLCTLWERDVTQRQVEKAWNLLNQRISNNTDTTSKM